MTANTISEYLAQFLLGLPYLVLVENLVICIFFVFLELWKFESFTEEMKKESFSLGSPATKLLSCIYFCIFVNEDKVNEYLLP